MYRGIISMKYVFATLLAVLLAVPALSETNPTNAFMGRWQDDGGYEMRILPEYQEDEEAGELALYPIDIFQSASEGKQVTWTMTARFNEKKDRLEYRDGTRIEDGSIVRTGSKGYLKLDGQGVIRWADSEESGSVKLAFQREPSPAPSEEDFAEDYFRAVAALERGSAGATLKAAQTIAQVLRFAEERALWNADGVAMQQNLNAAWDSLTPQEQARFDEAFYDGISDPADAAFEDYGALKHVFEDAGVGEEMARLTASLEVKLSWEYLSSATMNMDSIEDGDYDGAVG